MGSSKMDSSTVYQRDKTQGQGDSSHIFQHLVVLYNFNFLITQPIEAIDHPINLFVGCINLLFDVQRLFRFLKEIIFPFGLLR